MSTSRLMGVMFCLHFIHVVHLSPHSYGEPDFVAKIILVGVAVTIVIASYFMEEKKGHEQTQMEFHREMKKRNCPK